MQDTRDIQVKQTYQNSQITVRRRVLDSRYATVLVSLSLLFLVLVASPAIAGVSGKISGLVVDSQNGEPLIGATVRVEGSHLVTTTDEDGEYFIINVPVGKFDVSVTHVGFESILKKGVRVLLDLTTPVDFELDQMAIKLDEEVVVLASEPIIKKDITDSRIIYTSERLANLPNVLTVQSVLTNYPGVVIDGNNALHVRGGRSGQVSYYYDGFVVQDPFSLSPGIRIMPTALEELTLTSGGFTAEYGDALSGVVSAVTRDGGQTYHGSARVYEGFTHAYDVNSATWNSGLDNLGDRSVGFDLSGPIPGLDARRFSFFTAGEYLKQNGSLPHDYSDAYTGIAKLTFRPTANLKLKSNITYYEGDGAVYEHRDVNGASFDFNLDGLPMFEQQAYMAGLSGTYSFSSNMVATASVNRFFTSTLQSPEHLLGKHWSEWPGYSVDENGDYDGSIHTDNYTNNLSTTDINEMVGFAMGDRFDPTYANREAKYTALQANVVNQVNKTHQLKAGVEYRSYDVFWDFKQFYNEQPYGERYSSKPTYASMFIHDKLEYRDYIVNLGLRYDYRSSDISYNAAPDSDEPSYVNASSSGRVSPRLGISFPVAEQTVMHFNYGLYYQSPKFTYLYTNLQGDVGSGYPLLGNPNLEPEQTTSYELGLDHMIGSNLRIDATAYYKDIENLVTTRENYLPAKRVTATRFVNEDYGSVKGVDLALERLPDGDLFSWAVSYGYMIATGIGSNALDPYYTYITSTTDTLPPLKEYHLDYDQRHTVTAVAEFRVPRGWNGTLFGVKVPDAWGFNVTGYYGSGLPYTVTDNNGYRLGDRNEGRLPANYRVDMRFNKDFYLNKGTQFLTFYVEVDNLLNKRNIYNVYSSTGRPDDDSYTPQGGLALDSEELAAADRLYDHDPQNYSPPRAVRVGLRFTF